MRPTTAMVFAVLSSSVMRSASVVDTRAPKAILDVLTIALYQGTASAVPPRRQRKLGFSPCKIHSGAKAPSFLNGSLSARLKSRPDTNRRQGELN